MHQIFIVTSCSYMHAGLTAVMYGTREPVQICRVNQPEEILATPVSPGGRLVLVPVPRNEPRVAAGARMYLWQQELLCLSGRGPVLPCVLLSDSVSQEYRTLPEHTPVEILREVLSEILAHPEKAMRKVVPHMPRRTLSPLQEEILAGTLAGESVMEMAKRLGMPQRAIFAGRAGLLNKLGLENRLGLMALSGMKAV
ncbi:hypothetical protein F7396_20080 [Salmonella enterica]|nr:hypothetical protein [Salmonella enterica subsp. enterica serovar Sandiego]ECZ0995768.1 hypothetical protein [Salmonella enterica]